MPVRIQRQRTKGWRMPTNTVPVNRPSVFGNPFRWQDLIEINPRMTPGNARGQCVDLFKAWLAGSNRDWMGPASEAARKKILDRLPTLRGKNLACWCPPGAKCHADVLLELANKP